MIFLYFLKNGVIAMIPISMDFDSFSIRPNKHKLLKSGCASGGLTLHYKHYLSDRIKLIEKVSIMFGLKSSPLFRISLTRKIISIYVHYIFHLQIRHIILMIFS